jgi:hypothetical protein
MSFSIPRNTATAGQRTVPFFVGTAANPLAPATTGVVGLQPQISIGGAAYTNTGATVVAVNAASGEYAVVLTTGEVSAYGPFRIRLDDAAIAPVRVNGIVGPEALFSEPPALNVSGGVVEANVVQMNDANVIGNGTSGNLWRGA